MHASDGDGERSPEQPEIPRLEHLAADADQRRRANESLAWARNEVLDLIDLLVRAETDDDFAAVTMRLQQLTSASTDSGRRLAILLHFSTSLAAIVDLVESVDLPFDRANFRNQLRPVLRACLHEPRPRGRNHG